MTGILSYCSLPARKQTTLKHCWSRVRRIMSQSPVPLVAEGVFRLLAKGIDAGHPFPLSNCHFHCVEALASWYLLVVVARSNGSTVLKSNNHFVCVSSE